MRLTLPNGATIDAEPPDLIYIAEVHMRRLDQLRIDAISDRDLARRELFELRTKEKPNDP